MLKRILCGVGIFLIDVFVLGLIPGTPIWEILILFIVDFLFSKFIKVVIHNEKQ